MSYKYSFCSFFFHDLTDPSTLSYLLTSHPAFLSLFLILPHSSLSLSSHSLCLALPTFIFSCLLSSLSLLIPFLLCLRLSPFFSNKRVACPVGDRSEPSRLYNLKYITITLFPSNPGRSGRQLRVNINSRSLLT